MPKWHTDYERAEDEWQVSCPYCRASTRRPLLSDALKAGLEHEDRCLARKAGE